MKRVAFLLFLLLSIHIYSTDLKFGEVIRPRPMEYALREFLVEFEVENANILMAEFFTVAIFIQNSLGNMVYQELIEGANLEPFTTTTLQSTNSFFMELTGEYTLNLQIEFGEDIDPSNNTLEMDFSVIDFPGVHLPPDMGLDLFQINFTFENVQQEYSSYGLAATDFEKLSGMVDFTFGFINLYSPVFGWVVQNMIFDLTSGYPGLSTMFNLGFEEPMSGYQGFAILTEAPIYDFTPIEYDFFVIESIDYNAQGRNAPIGNIPAPIPFDSIKFQEGGRNDLVWQHGHVNIEQDVNQCGPAAVANSLQWLENDQGIDVPHEHRPGIRDSSLVGELDKAMQRQPHQTVSDANALRGKIKYVDDNNLTDTLKLKHKNRKGTTFVANDTVKVGNTMSVANTDTALSLIDWILQELKDGEDVELGIGWDGGGGHWVDLIGGGYVDGVPWFAWVHDANQAYDGMGTANVNDDTVKHNGGITPQTGGYGWSYIIDNKLASVVGNDTSRGTIDLAFSESVDTSTVTSVLENYNESLENQFSLSQNYPNPFNPSTTIKFTLPVDSKITLKIYDILGSHVRTLSSGIKKAGSYEIEFRADNLASGVYIYELRTDNFYDSKKMILVK